MMHMQSQIVSIELEINYIDGFRDGAGIMLERMCIYEFSIISRIL